MDYFSDEFKDLV
jgi:serine/threonine protein kinase